MKIKHQIRYHKIRELQVVILPDAHIKSLVGKGNKIIKVNPNEAKVEANLKNQ